MSNKHKKASAVTKCSRCLDNEMRRTRSVTEYLEPDVQMEEKSLKPYLREVKTKKEYSKQAIQRTILKNK